MYKNSHSLKTVAKPEAWGRQMEEETLSASPLNFLSVETVFCMFWLVLSWNRQTYLCWNHKLGDLVFEQVQDCLCTVTLYHMNHWCSTQCLSILKAHSLSATGLYQGIDLCWVTLWHVSGPWPSRTDLSWELKSSVEGGWLLVIKEMSV